MEDSRGRRTYMRRLFPWDGRVDDVLYPVSVFTSRSVHSTVAEWALAARKLPQEELQIVSTAETKSVELVVD